MRNNRWIAAIAAGAFATIASAADAAVIGTNGNDFLFFNGDSMTPTNVKTLSTTITNAYSGATVSVNGTFNVNRETYDGLGGTDTFFFTRVNDFLAIRDSGGNQTISNVEVIIAGAGSDIINLSDATISLGDMLIDGGASNDVIWANVGNDTLRGLGGDDIIDGGPGNDIIDAGRDQDTLFGGTGADVLNGGIGADLLVGGDGDDTLKYSIDAIAQPGGPTPGNNLNHDTFIGGAGVDTLVMTSGDDTIFLGDNSALPRHPDSSGPRVSGIETLLAGEGDDSIYFDLASDIEVIDGDSSFRPGGGFHHRNRGFDEIVFPVGLDLIDLEISKTGDMMFDIAFGPGGMFSTRFVEQLRFDNGDVFDLANFVPPVAVPAPPSLPLFLAGLVGLAFFGARRRQGPVATRALARP